MIESFLMKTKLLLTTACLAAFSFIHAAPAQEPARMKAIVYHNYGSPEVLRLEEIEKPVPKDDQVLVKVRAASVNPYDWHFIRGEPYLIRLFVSGLFQPKEKQLGVDFAGTIEAVGKNVTQLKPGDDVFGGQTGAFAEYICVAERKLARKPANVTFAQAASVPIAGVTALQGLRDKGKLQPGQKVLINGASGGVGTFAVQIAKSFGAEVTGVCSARNADMVRSLGADHVIDYTKKDFTKGGQHYDLILDMVASHSLSEFTRALTPQGTLVLIGSTETGLWLKPVILMLRGAVYARFASQHIVNLLADMNQKDLTAIADLMEAGKVTPVIDRTYTLSQTAEAVRYVEEGHSRGKVVINLEDDTSPTSATPAANAGSTLGPALRILALFVIVLGVPIAGALPLNRRFQQRNPGKRPYRWGYYFSILSFIAGLTLGYLVEAGFAVVLICGVIYAVLAWFFAARRHWAWIALTLLSFNPLIWIINLIYLWKRWAEPAARAPAQ